MGWRFLGFSGYIAEVLLLMEMQLAPTDLVNMMKIVVFGNLKHKWNIMVPSGFIRI